MPFPAITAWLGSTVGLVLGGHKNLQYATVPISIAYYAGEDPNAGQTGTNPPDVPSRLFTCTINNFVQNEEVMSTITTTYSAFALIGFNSTSSAGYFLNHISRDGEGSGTSSGSGGTGQPTDTGYGT